MPELNLSDIDLISNEIRNQGITFSHLADELIDHICCDVENEMKKGVSFSEAYNAIKKRMGSRRLNEIQEETLYAVDSKYRQMKNTMKISGIAGTVLLGIASLFKIMHWPLAGAMMSLGAITLAFVFMPSALGVLWKETHSSKRMFLFISAFFAAMFFLMGILFKVQHWPGAAIILSMAGISGVLFFVPALLAASLKKPDNKTKKPIYILGAIGLICYIAGLLFKIQHWPLANLLLVAGLFILFILVFPWYTKITWNNDSFIKAEYIYLVVGSLAIIVPSLLVSLNMQRSYDTGYYLINEQEKALYNYLSESNRSYLVLYHDSSTYSSIEQLHSKTNELLRLINTVESKMIAGSEGKPGLTVENPPQIRQTENGPEIDFGSLPNPFHPSPVQDFLIPGAASRQELESLISGYRKYLTTILPDSELQAILKMIDPANILPHRVSAEKKISLMSGLHSLAILKNSLLTVESYSLKRISRHM